MLGDVTYSLASSTTSDDEVSGDKENIQDSQGSLHLYSDDTSSELVIEPPRRNYKIITMKAALGVTLFVIAAASSVFKWFNYEEDDDPYLSVLGTIISVLALQTISYLLMSVGDQAKKSIQRSWNLQKSYAVESFETPVQVALNLNQTPLLQEIFSTVTFANATSNLLNEGKRILFPTYPLKDKEIVRVQSRKMLEGGQSSLSHFAWEGIKIGVGCAGLISSVYYGVSPSEDYGASSFSKHFSIALITHSIGVMTYFGLNSLKNRLKQKEISPLFQESNEEKRSKWPSVIEKITGLFSTAVSFCIGPLMMAQNNYTFGVAWFLIGFHKEHVIHDFRTKSFKIDFKKTTKLTFKQRLLSHYNINLRIQTAANRSFLALLWDWIKNNPAAFLVNGAFWVILLGWIGTVYGTPNIGSVSDEALAGYSVFVGSFPLFYFMTKTSHALFHNEGCSRLRNTLFFYLNHYPMLFPSLYATIYRQMEIGDIVLDEANNPAVNIFGFIAWGLLGVSAAINRANNDILDFENKEEDRRCPVLAQFLVAKDCSKILLQRDVL